MQHPTPPEVCAFCGTIGAPSTHYASGFGVLMCEECVGYFSQSVPTAPERLTTRYDITSLSNDQMLEMLPRIASNASAVNRFMASWVEHIRDRSLSWTTIGNALGISRQAAWERFTRMIGSDRDRTS